MSDSNPSSSAPVFVTTQWTLVMQAQGDTPEAKAALGDLCEAYWMPVYRFLKRDGREEDKARDLTQDFFARLLSRGGIGQVDRQQGRFRSYLLGALKHFLSNLKRDAARQKRGGQATVESLQNEESSGDSLDLQDPQSEMRDTWFDRQWAMTLMERALAQVRSEFQGAGKAEQFETLKPWLIGETENLSQAEAARQLNMKEGAVKVAVHRLRKAFRAAIKNEISQTVSTPQEITTELRYLVEVLS